VCVEITFFTPLLRAPNLTSCPIAWWETSCIHEIGCATHILIGRLHPSVFVWRLQVSSLLNFLFDVENSHSSGRFAAYSVCCCFLKLVGYFSAVGVYLFPFLLLDFRSASAIVHSFNNFYPWNRILDSYSGWSFLPDHIYCEGYYPSSW
jgi:hypothetical protein